MLGSGKGEVMLCYSGGLSVITEEAEGRGSEKEV
jgi:hypothetical protein